MKKERELLSFRVKGSLLCSALHVLCPLAQWWTVAPASSGEPEEDYEAGGGRRKLFLPVFFLLGFYRLYGPVSSIRATLPCSSSTSRAVLSSKFLCSGSPKLLLCSTILRMVAASCNCCSEPPRCCLFAFSILQAQLTIIY